MQSKLERCHNTKVSAAASKRPEKIAVIARCRAYQAAIGEDDVGREQVVAAEAVLASQMAMATSECQTANSSGGDDATAQKEEKKGLPKSYSEVKQ